MAQTAVYRCEERSFKKNKHKQLQAYKPRRITKQRFKEKIAALKEERKHDMSRKRVVFFGGAKYGHGSPCPVPRKELVRAIPLLCPVLLVDDFQTSQTCRRCGAGTEKDEMDVNKRRVRCLSKRCNARKVNRDVNASADIGKCGVHMLHGLPHPSRLCRPVNQNNK